MTLREKRQFTNQVVRAIKRGILKDLKRVPTNWEGAELRYYIRDIFDGQLVFGQFRDRRNPHYKVYRNDLIVNGL